MQAFVLLLSIALLSACAPPAPATSPTSLTDSQQPDYPTTHPPNYPTNQPPFYFTPHLYDAHLHYSQNSWGDYSVSEIKTILDRAGIKRALVSSTPNEGTLKLYDADPTRFVPEFRPYRTEGDLGRWFTTPETVAFIEQGLSQNSWRGIGEFHLYGDQAKTPTVNRIVEIAAQRDLVLHAHSDELAIENLFAANPHAKILWAHTGMSTPTPIVEQMLARHPGLWTELSYRYDVSQNGKLDPAWRALFLKYPDRFMYGTDTWVPNRWEELPSLVSTARGWLAELPLDVAERIAQRNFETLFGK